MRTQIDFELYGQINRLNQILEVYDISEEVHQSIEHCSNLIKTKHYNVAVVGEFNRGKSSLINALLGGSILPTDILPTTAVINRITYGTKEKVEVFYKDGTKDLININEIDDTVTKITKEKEEKALAINEVVIHYPAIICQNNIDIIDTPGLNEDDLMTEVTLKQLKKIDAAIMVVSALSPFSDVEKNIVINMLENDEINDIVFVVSFIDLLDEATRPRVIDDIAERITDIIDDIEMLHDDRYIIEKAKRILGGKKIFGVSSLMAIEAIETGNNQKLQSSNYPIFRKELTRILTAGQSVNVVEKVCSLISLAHRKIDEWLTEKETKLKSNVDAFKLGATEIEDYTATKVHDISDDSLNKAELEFDKISSREILQEKLTKCAVKRLAEVKTNSEREIRLAIGEIQKLLQTEADHCILKDRDDLKALYEKCLSDISDARGRAWVAAYKTKKKTLFQPHLFEQTFWGSWDDSMFPIITFKRNDFFDTEYLLHSNVMRPISDTIETMCDRYYSALEEYRKSCRKTLFNLLKDEAELCQEEVLPYLKEKRKEMDLNLVILRREHEKNMEKLEVLFDENNAILADIRAN